MSVRRSSAVVCAVLFSLLGVTASDSAAAADLPSFRLLGSYGLETFGYEDAAEADRLWLEQIGRFSLYRLGGPWSLHGTVSHLSCFDDDFCGSGRGRFLKGFVRYGGLDSRVDLRAGRFFLVRGVAVGVFDGADLLLRSSRHWRFGLFLGLAGPRSREFEFEDPEDAFTFGAGVRHAPRGRLLSAVHDLGLSYVRQQREEGVTRHLVGVSTRSRWGRSFTLLNVVHLRPRGDALRKVVTRGRVRSADWAAFAEVGVFKPIRNEYTWLGDFDAPSSHRFRLGLDRFLGGGPWAAGAEGALLAAGDESGFRGGPVIASPWGRAGYRFSGGGQAQVSGPWISLRVSPGRGLTLHAYGSSMNYEWDAFELDSGEIATIRAGASYTPPQYPALTVRGEFQAYRTPQFEQDRRALVGLNWRFDTASGVRAGGVR